ncbi:type II secretion protein, partial [Haloferax sp. AB510]|nr:type II secretion protein [Haloferax sp. AB510]
MPLDSSSIGSLSETVAAALPNALGDRLADATGARVAPCDSTDGCGCVTAFSTPTDRPDDDTVTLAVDASGCPHRGSLSTAPACRATVVEALETRDADRLVVRADGLERRYDDAATGLLVAAGRFAERVRFRDDR